MSPELLHLIHKQKSAHRRVIKTKRRGVDLIIHHRKLRNQVNNMYRRLKNEYFQLRLQQYRKSPRHLWSAINHVTCRHRQHHPSTAQLSDWIAHFRSLLYQPDQTNVLPSGPDKSTSAISLQYRLSKLKNLSWTLGMTRQQGRMEFYPQSSRWLLIKYLTHCLFSLTNPCRLDLYPRNSKLAI